MAKEPETEAKTKQPATVVLNRNWAYGLGGLLVLLIILMAGVGFAGRHEEFRESMPVGGFKAGMVARPHGYMMGGGANVNSGSLTRGVVTSVNGSSFTVAGNGATTNVTTDSSTQYQGGNAVKQNDTVVVYGAIANNTLSATKIVINP